MTQVLSWRNSPDPRAALAAAIEALRAAQTVVFPTETGYVLAAAADQPAAVEAILPFAESQPLLGVAGPGHAEHLCADFDRMARRLARRFWPGPVTLLVSTALRNGETGVSPDVRALASWERDVPLRSPAHSAILHAMHELGTPLALATMCGSDGAGLTVDQVVARLGELPSLIIDDGSARYDQPPTVVRVAADRWEVVRAGVISDVQVQAQAACLIVFVCTGNTCRSPLAEALCRRRLAEHLGCSPAELPERGYLVVSAGLAAADGEPASADAVQIAADYQADLFRHGSRFLRRELALQADYLVCMTDAHLQLLRAQYPYLGCAPRLLSPEGKDLLDPIGQDESVYRVCAEQIWNDLASLVPLLAPCGAGPHAG